jgi:riboflavin biosynthesis pyrimidine reductase
MRALLPEPADHVDLATAYALPQGRPGEQPGDRPFVRINMISSLDGAIALRGRSGALGGPADRQVFQVLRSLADVIVVGAGTVRAEAYGPARLDAAQQEQRRARGQVPVPPIAVVTRTSHFDWGAPFFTEADARPIVVTTAEADTSATARGADRAEFVVAGTGDVDLAGALSTLAGRGARNVLVEGGPGLNAQLVTAGLMDELCLTLSPCLAAGTGPRVLAGPELPDTIDVEIVHLLEEGGFSFLRLRRRAAATRG